jgi:hypothetical protein
MFKICDYVLKNKIFINEIINIASSNYYSILEVVKLLEKKAGKNGNYEIMDL